MVDILANDLLLVSQLFWADLSNYEDLKKKLVYELLSLHSLCHFSDDYLYPDVQ